MSKMDKTELDVARYELKDIETLADYGCYEERFARFMEYQGLANLSTDPRLTDDDEENEEEDGEDDYADDYAADEPYFSWRFCDCCERNLGGDRYTCSGYNPTTKKVQRGYSVCTDCVYYAEYGTLDDDTMWKIGQPNRH